MTEYVADPRAAHELVAAKIAAAADGHVRFVIPDGDHYRVVEVLPRDDVTGWVPLEHMPYYQVYPGGRIVMPPPIGRR